MVVAKAVALAMGVAVVVMVARTVVSKAMALWRETYHTKCCNLLNHQLLM